MTPASYRLTSLNRQTGELSGIVPDLSFWNSYPYKYGGIPGFDPAPSVRPTDVPPGSAKPDFDPLNIDHLRALIDPVTMADVSDYWRSTTATVPPMWQEDGNVYPYLTAGYRQRLGDFRQSANIIDIRNPVDRELALLHDSLRKFQKEIDRFPIPTNPDPEAGVTTWPRPIM